VLALRGDNVVNVSEKYAWYTGLPFDGDPGNRFMNRDVNEFFRLPVQYVNRPHLDFRGFSGTVVRALLSQVMRS